MLLNTPSQIHFDQVARRFPPGQDHVGVSNDELVELLGSIVPFGVWRLELETSLVYWSDDAARIHGMEPTDEAVSLSRIIGRFHPEDALLIEDLVESASEQHTSFRFVMRIDKGDGTYKLIAVAGRYRPDNGGELFGYCHEYQDMVRAVVLAEE